MADLIDRQEAIVTAVKAAIDWHRLANPQYSIAYCIGEAMRELPSAERHGEWIQKSTGGESFYTCSRCGFIAWEHEDTNYCPNCGARMDGKQDG